MKININGQDFVGFTNAYVSRSFLEASGHFRFFTSPKNINSSYPIKVGDSCQIIVNNTPFLTGYIETMEVVGSANNIEILISGRDRTADLIDSTLDYTIIENISSTITFKQFCQLIINNLGITNLGVISNIDSLILNREDFIAPSTGEGAFEFLEKYAKKLQVLLTTEGLGNLVIDRSIYDVTSSPTIPTYILNQIQNNTSNNVLDFRFHLDTSQRFNNYKCYSQTAAISLDNNDDGSEDFKDVSADDYTSQEGQYIDPQIRSGRTLIFISDTPIYNETATDRAIWEANHRKALGSYYQCKVSDHTYNGNDVWQPNNLVQVIDDFANINSIMLIDTVSFYESATGGEGGGKLTSLKLIPPNSYTLQEQENYQQSLSEYRGINYFVGQ